MKLLVLMYHHASAGRHGNAAGMLEAHFSYIAEHLHCLLPGEALDEQRLNVCLSFDDGYYDFYAVVFPLLKKYGLRAMLAVPVSFLRERTDIPATIRLQACAERIPDCGVVGGYCTWPELAEMTAGGSVAIAAHGFTHTRLDQMRDLHTEIVVPQTLLSARLGQTVESLVLPYGRFSPAVLEQAQQCYRYVFRIGSADNMDWNGPLLYRINADEMSTPQALFTQPRLALYQLRRQWNQLRGR